MSWCLFWKVGLCGSCLKSHCSFLLMGRLVEFSLEIWCPRRGKATWVCAAQIPPGQLVMLRHLGVLGWSVVRTQHSNCFHLLPGLDLRAVGPAQPIQFSSLSTICWEWVHGKQGWSPDGVALRTECGDRLAQDPGLEGVLCEGGPPASSQADTSFCWSLFCVDPESRAV